MAQTNCSLSDVILLILAAIGLLSAAIVVSLLWPTVVPLFIAAGLVVFVSTVLIPAIKSALLAYTACRGPSEKCTISSAINDLGTVAMIISAISFAVAGVIQIAALGFLTSVILSWIGVTLEAAVVALVSAGQIACGAGIILLLGVLTDVNNYANCMNKQQSGFGLNKQGGPGNTTAT